MFALAVTTRPIKFPPCQCAGTYAFNELFYTIGKKLQTVFLLIPQMTPELNAVKKKIKKIVAYCLKYCVCSCGRDVLGQGEQTAGCRTLSCPRRQAPALTETDAHTRMWVHIRDAMESLPPPPK